MSELLAKPRKCAGGRDDMECVLLAEDGDIFCEGHRDEHNANLVIGEVYDVETVSRRMFG